MNNKTVALISILPMLISSQLSAVTLGNDDCDSLLLVSSYDQDNVKIFDGCDGEYIRDLDDEGLIAGAQAIIELEDGRILVASEKNNRLIAYDRETLSQGEIVVDSSTSGFIETPLGLATDENNQLYVASYSENKIVVINTDNWSVSSTLLASDNGLIKGIDAGTVIDEGFLYAPGYDSDNVIKIDLSNGQVTEIVKSATDGLDRARGVAILNDELFVTSEKTGHIKVFNKNSGDLIRSMAVTALPAGIEIDGDNHLLYNNRQAVYQVGINGEGNTQVTKFTSKLAGATFVHRVMKVIDSDQDGLTDQEETILGTDPNNTDSENDGMPDGWEAQHNLDPLKDDANSDADEDGLTNLLEFQAQLDPNKQDTDEDGLDDLSDSLPLTPSTQPMLSGAPEETVQQDETYLFKPELSYPGNASQVQFEIENKPAWAGFSTQSGELTGTVTNSDVGEYANIIIRATNQHLANELAPFSIVVVNVNDAPVQKDSFSSSGGSFQINSAISIDLSQHFEDVDAEDSITFTAEDLPAGFTLTEQGELSSTGIDTVGEIQLSFKVTDTAGASLSSQITINIVAAAEKPIVENKPNSGGSMFYLLLLATSCIAIRRKFLTLK